MEKYLKLSEAKIPSEWGELNFYTFATEINFYSPEIVIIHPKTNFKAIVNLRIHSECITGDLFKSLKCDCRSQLEFSLNYIAKNKGMFIYHRQEGRNIGISNKLNAYNLQNRGLNTIEANLKLGFNPDNRNYTNVIKILDHFKVKNVNLLTNNPLKISFLEENNIAVKKRIHVDSNITKNNEKYINIKIKEFLHFAK